MAHYRIGWQDELPASCRGLAVAIGNFDGAHRGHAALLGELKHQARKADTRAAVLTFDPHPLALLRPEAAPLLLTTPDDRAEFLQALGADEVLTLRTEPGLLGLAAEDFFHRVVLGQLAARALCEGPNFGFGKGRGGDVALLRRLCAEAGIPFTAVPRFGEEGAPVSSSRIREALTRGDVAAAARLLGRPYLLRGVVGTGQMRGRTIGFPTANLTQARTVVPGEGVYAARALVGDATWPAAVNIGGNPTFGEHHCKIEAHLIGFDGDLYGRPLGLEFLIRLRGTRRFSSVDELSRQLAEDVEATRRVAPWQGAGEGEGAK